MSTNETEAGGVREVCVEIKGQGAYSRMKFESGVHRVQRVPTTEAKPHWLIPRRHRHRGARQPAAPRILSATSPPPSPSRGPSSRSAPATDALDETLVVVTCAGRTRSIIGAQALINAGVPNKVVALGGTKSWMLAGLSWTAASRVEATVPHAGLAWA